MKKLMTLIGALALTATFSTATFARSAEEIRQTNQWTDTLNLQTAESIRNRDVDDVGEWFVLTSNGEAQPVAQLFKVIAANKAALNKDTDANRVMPAQ